MPYLNKVVVMGHTGKDPEIRTSQGGMTVVNVNIATSKTVKGEKKTEWHRIVLFDKRADLVAKHVKKGDLLYVEGEIQTREWTDKGGTKHYTTEILATDVRLFAYADGSEKEPAREKEREEEKPYTGDLPF